MKRRRRLRRLVPDDDLVRRRAAGEPLRDLAAAYDVAHTTLGRYFARPDVAKELKQAAKQLRAADRVREARRLADRRLEEETRRKARKQSAADRTQARTARAASADRATRRPRARSDYEAWLDERDARQRLTRADLYSRSDEIAAEIVAEGGGIQAVIEATNLRTLENVARLIDPEIVVRAFDNDLLAQTQRPPGA